MSYKRIVFEAHDNFDDAPIRVRPIKSKPIKKQNQPNDNFLEFRRIYGNLINKNFGKKPLYRYDPKPLQSRPRIEVKTIQLEMPILGAEKAVVNTKNSRSPKKVTQPKPKKKIEVKTHATSTHELVRKLSQMEHSLSKDSKISIHQGTSTFIDITNRELQVANEQLRHIKELLEQKKVDVTTPKPLLSKKKTRHTDCVKKYLSNLTSMRKKLKDLEDKFYKRPQVIYKSVSERFTQSSLETLYKNETFSPDAKFDAALDDAISELEDIVKVKISDEFKSDNTLDDITLIKVMLDKNDIQNPTSQTIVQPDQIPVKLPSSPTEICIDSNPTYLFDDHTFPDFSTKLINNFLAGEEAGFIPRAYMSNCSNIALERSMLPDNKQSTNVMEKSKSNKSVHFEPKVSEDYVNDTESKKYNWLDSTKAYVLGEERGDVKVTSPPNKEDLKQYRRSNSFKMVLDNFNYDSGDSVSKFIDLSERRLNKYRHLKQDVLDINAFCDKLCDLTQSDEEDEGDLRRKEKLEQISVRMFEETPNIPKEPTTKEPSIEDQNLFDYTMLQDSVMKSAFLMKEFNIKPKVFTEKHVISPDKKKFFQVANKCKESGDSAVKNLLQSLEVALENSVYTVADTNI